MEVGNFDQAELDTAIAAFSATAKKYIGVLDQSDMTRCRQLLVEALLNSVTAMHESVSVMSLMMVQAQDHGHKQGRNAVFKQIELARQAQTKGGIMVPVEPMKEHTLVYERNEADRPAALRLTEARTDQLRAQYDSHMPSNEADRPTAKLIASVTAEAKSVTKALDVVSKLGTDPLIAAIREPVTLSTAQKEVVTPGQPDDGIPRLASVSALDGQSIRMIPDVVTMGRLDFGPGTRSYWLHDHPLILAPAEIRHAEGHPHEREFLVKILNRRTT